MPLEIPELRERAVLLLDRLKQIQGAGIGGIPVIDLITLFGLPVAPELMDRLRGRGSIELEFGDSAGGTFRNVGTPLAIPLGPCQLRIPQELAGSIMLDDMSAELVFDPAKTMVGRAFLMELKLQRLELSDHHAALRLPGGVLDQVVNF